MRLGGREGAALHIHLKNVSDDFEMKKIWGQPNF
jgi:hypothetical protein